jgi:hypothetical protein
MTRCSIDDRVSFVFSVWPCKKKVHSSYFVGGSAIFLCFIFLKYRARQAIRLGESNGLIIIDKVM